ncbi:nuclear mRNA export, poly(A)+RNA binding protein [Cladophialophora chaetospira]|uniref:Nuclear mRNA export, poly(A)+RNA binding protein n=1 Tax=Cladophialophora chaetospira TaxID=386627 RepID=A0AA39CF00_9EURO|nr:nuclear mRNA export, poly(A)+RNA binding protein [Cladophialophora chaetospira]
MPFSGSSSGAPGVFAYNAPTPTWKTVITRPSHPEVLVSSNFALAAPEKPSWLLDREIMGLKFSLATRLTLRATHECLEANGWSYTHAMSDFEQLHKRGAIPAEKYLGRY